MDSEKKVVIEEVKQGRSVGLLAGAVVLLAVAFIVFITCGTVVLRNQDTCDNTNTPPKQEETVTKNIDVDHDETKTHERITMYPESQVELIVNRNADTGHVESVVTIEYNKKTSTLYRAADNRCYMLKGYEFGKFDDTMTELDKLPDSNSEAKELKLNMVVGERVTNASEIAVQMSAFCSTQNTHYLEEVDPDDAHDRQKRQTYICLYYCEFVGWVFIYPYWYEWHICIYYYDWSADCLSPDSNFYYGPVYIPIQ